MAVKIDCSICDKFIKKAEEDDLKKLTGREICSGCRKKINDTMTVLDEAVSDYKKEIEKMLAEAKKKFGELDTAHNKFYTNATSLHTTMKAELKRRMEDIL